MEFLTDKKLILEAGMNHTHKASNKLADKIVDKLPEPTESEVRKEIKDKHPHDKVGTVLKALHKNKK